MKKKIRARFHKTKSRFHKQNRKKKNQQSVMANYMKSIQNLINGNQLLMYYTIKVQMQHVLSYIFALQCTCRLPFGRGYREKKKSRKVASPNLISFLSSLSSRLRFPKFQVTTLTLFIVLVKLLDSAAASQNPVLDLATLKAKLLTCKLHDNCKRIYVVLLYNIKLIIFDGSGSGFST